MWVGALTFSFPDLLSLSVFLRLQVSYCVVDDVFVCEAAYSFFFFLSNFQPGYTTYLPRLLRDPNAYSVSNFSSLSFDLSFSNSQLKVIDFFPTAIPHFVSYRSIPPPSLVESFVGCIYPQVCVIVVL
ncbi:hypothetical protein BJ742DRAFT_76128 [Cladochytrium replicatum]|nr:hypothetical protein BJ742DRAFT_76128 [Cladochytrium replicatum]